MAIRKILVGLPSNWHEVEPKAYRMKGNETGWLHISLHPRGNFESLEDALEDLLENIGLDVGEQIRGFQDEATLGPMAISLRQSASKGLLQFWLIDAGKIWVFVSYTMGDLSTATEEMAQAQQIVKQLRIE